MKKNLLSILFCSLLSAANAQTYSQGDIQVNPQPMMSHDSAICASTINLIYGITVTNSFIGDSVKIKDMSTGSLIVSDVNTTGANPWYVFLPVPIYNMFISDDQLSGGTAMFFGPTVKVISGADTVFNINNTYFFPVSNPCSYGSVSGRIYVDYNSDCAFNSGDVALSSVPAVSNVSLNSPSMSSTSSTAYSDATGSYNMTVQQSWMTNYNVAIPMNYQFIFPSTACSPGVYSFTTLSQSNVDFSLQCSSNVDVQTYASSSGMVRPNVPFYLHPAVSNTGCNSASGQLKLVLDNRVIYNAALSSSPLPTISGDTLIWTYSNLTNLTNGGYWNSFFANVHLTPNSSVNIGDNLCFRVLTNIPAGDVNAANNDYSFCLPVVNSYDPNFKEVSPQGSGASGLIDFYNETELTYTIHFQNTGTAAALNISVIDTLDSDLIPNSLVILGSSHAVTPEWISPGVVKFNFNNINLADSSSNEAASHGSVTFKIERQAFLAPGTQIKNTGDIYFDFNSAIVTNTTLNTIGQPNTINENKLTASSVNVYPNPFSNVTTFMINSDNLNDGYSLIIKDVLGKTVRNITSAEKEFVFSRDGLNNGMYFYSITNKDGLIANGKLIIK